MPEQEPPQARRELNLPVASEEIIIPGLHPDAGNPDSKTFHPSNLDDLMPDVAQALGKREWFGKLAQDVLDNKKSAVFVTLVGGIVIFAAAGVGYEFGLRKGKDIRHLIEKIGDLRGKNPQE